MGKNVIQGLADIAGQSVHNERLSAAILSPGHIVEETTAGLVQVHSTAAANAQKLVALTNLSNGGTPTDAYISGETVRYGAFHSGQKSFLRLAASAPAVVIGDALESAGDGTVRKVVTDAATDGTQRDSIIGYAVEAVNNSGGGSEVFIEARIA